MKQNKEYHGFHDLIVYQKAYELGVMIFELSKEFPKEEKFALINQIRKSSRSVAANIAEAWAFRRYPKSFVSKLNISFGEAFETGVWLDFARDHKYISEQTHQIFCEKCVETQKMLRAIIHSPDKFTY
ncbi:MAG: four helix bundle protein [Candidatus Marinimicrobia bacterium]|nr:four helix bundle protein [Candidatus Neomarinimicrobiota bacterium]